MSPLLQNGFFFLPSKVFKEKIRNAEKPGTHSPYDVRSELEHIAELRSTTLEKLQQSFEEDLDRITMKALEYRPSDRYEFVRQLSEELTCLDECALAQ